MSAQDQRVRFPWNGRELEGHPIDPPLWQPKFAHQDRERLRVQPEDCPDCPPIRVDVEQVEEV